MYFSYWIILVALSLGVSLLAFVWGLCNGQFSDQTRARYLPLGDQSVSPPPACPAGAKIERCALVFIALLGLSGIAALIILSLYRLKG